jgi:maltose phosphorylase
MDATQNQLKNGLGTSIAFPYIKQADVLQCFYFFEEHFSKEELKHNFEFYESFTVHEIFSMCTFHTSCFIRQDGHGLYFYLNIRLDLDDYNKRFEELSYNLYGWNMDEYWKVLVECVKNDTLNFLKKFQNNGNFIHNFRNQIITGCHYHFKLFQWTELKT